MSDESLDTFLDREPAGIECPICRHRQWLRAAIGRCDQCGSEIELFRDAEAADRALRALLEDGRVAYRVDAQDGLTAVVANRRFGGGR